jgi:hypothetical protein
MAQKRTPGSLQEPQGGKGARSLHGAGLDREIPTISAEQTYDVDSETEEEDDFEGPRQTDEDRVRTTCLVLA